MGDRPVAPSEENVDTNARNAGHSAPSEGMGARLRRMARDLARSVIGALFFASPFLYTMETWWLGWRLPGEYLIAYALVGLGIVVVLVRTAGFRVSEAHSHPAAPWQVVVDTLDLALESFLAAYVALLIFGVLEFGDPLHVFARVGLIQVVPLALGAAIANRVLSGEGDGAIDAPFPKDVAIFAVGALFLSLPIAPTEEMQRIAAHATWNRLGVLVVAALLLAYLVLFELEFRGQPARMKGLTPRLQAGEVFLVYATAVLVSFVLLAAFGHFRGAPVTTWVQSTIVLSFLATLGGSAARVIL